MIFSRLNGPALATAIAAVALAGVAIAFGRPTPIESALLGAEWQCSRTVFITTCAPRVQQATPAMGASHKEARGPREADRCDAVSLRC